MTPPVDKLGSILVSAAELAGAAGQADGRTEQVTDRHHPDDLAVVLGQDRQVAALELEHRRGDLVEVGVEVDGGWRRGHGRAADYADDLVRLLVPLSTSGSVRYHVIPGIRRQDLFGAPSPAVAGQEQGPDAWWRLAEAEPLEAASARSR